MNQGRDDARACECHRTNHRSGRRTWIIALAALNPVAALAQLHALPYADMTYEYDSNVFALPSSAVEPIGDHGPAFSDRLLEERAGVNALYDLSLQEFYANVEARHFDYDHFSALSHDEYLVHAGMKWQLGYLFDGVVDYRHERSMVQFLDFTATQLGLQPQLFVQQLSVTTASANFQFAPQWRVESRGIISDLDSPRPGLPNLSLTENSVQGGVHYVGVAKLSAGIDAIFLNGHFNGDEFVLTPRYNQNTVEATAKYIATGLSSFNGAIGYTRRRQEDAATIGGITGLLAYQRDLTSLTSVNIKLSRAINSYVTYGGSEIDTSVALGAIWNATGKIAVTPSYQWLYSTFPAINAVGLPFVGTERHDHYQLAKLTVKYQLLNWLSLRPYAQYETRNSDVGIYSFNRTLFGLEFELRLSGQADQPYELSLPDY